MKEDPPPDAKCRDKFLVQTVQIPAGQEINNAQALVCFTIIYLTLPSSPMISC
jgi:hypothetical protein